MSRLLRRAAWALLAANLVLLAVAVARGGVRIPDAGVFVTNGWLVAWGILATLAVVAVIPRVVHGDLGAAAQVLALGMQAAHSVGHLAQLYYLLPWYDDLLHASSTLGIGVLATLVLRRRDPAVSRHLGALGTAFVVFAAVVTAAALWEVFEYGMDSAFGTHEQDDLRDTMLDVVDGVVGGALAAGWAWRTSRHATRSLSLPTRSSRSADSSTR